VQTWKNRSVFPPKNRSFANPSPTQFPAEWFLRTWHRLVQIGWNLLSKVTSGRTCPQRSPILLDWMHSQRCQGYTFRTSTRHIQVDCLPWARPINAHTRLQIHLCSRWKPSHRPTTIFAHIVKNCSTMSMANIMSTPHIPHVRGMLGICMH